MSKPFHYSPALGLLVSVLTSFVFVGCGQTTPEVKKIVPQDTTIMSYDEKNYRVDTKVKPQVGKASYYAKCFHGRRTASGEKCDARGYSAAHRTWPFGTIVRVTMLQNGKSVLVKVNDRGPFHRSRVVDISTAAAKKIGLIGPGVATVKVERLVKVH